MRDTNSNHYVYEITNLVNGKKYIGKRSCNCPIEEDKYMGSGKLLKRAINKYGIENFKKEILQVCDNEEKAFELEKTYIEQVRAYKNKNYYNISAGGNGGFNNFAGKTEEELELWKEKMSKSRKGRIITKEWTDKILKTRKEKGIGIGETNGMYGRTGAKNPVSKPTLMFSLEGKLIKEFECIREASDYIKKGTSSYISKVCINKTGYAYGYIFCFKSDYDYMMHNKEFVNWIEKSKEKHANKSTKKILLNNKPIYQLKQCDFSIANEFKSIKDASTILQIPSKEILRVCIHGNNTCRGFHYIFKEEYVKLNKIQLKRLFQVKNGKKVICINTLEVFECMEDAKSKYGITSNKISSCCKGKQKTTGKHPVTGERLKWMYYNDYQNKCDKKVT